jgi:hypothetical protein
VAGRFGGALGTGTCETPCRAVGGREVTRAALLPIHARVEETQPSTWEDRSLVQLWGPRGNVFVVAARHHAVFSLGTLPGEVNGRRRAEDLAARLELARRYLHIHGPPTAEAFAWWANLRPRHGVAVFQALSSSLTPVQTPVGEAWILSRDEPTLRAAPGAVAPARLLPSGDAYLLAQGADRELLVPDSDRRRALWTPRVWPGGLLLDGEIVGTWRRADQSMTIQPWRPLSGGERDAVALCAATAVGSATVS